jgi:flavin reductase (DIM6/NTAB) family NADH-FMN oxidoreductase RutF
MKEAWMEAFGKVTHGIYVLTTFHAAEFNGMIASWVSQVSYQPPLIMVAVHPNRFSHELIRKSGCFALHILSQRQTDLVARFKGPDPSAKFENLKWGRGKTGCPVLENCVAVLECEVREAYRPGNHTLYVGELVHGRLLADERPLSTLDYDGVYVGRA